MRHTVPRIVAFVSIITDDVVVFIVIDIIGHADWWLFYCKIPYRFFERFLIHVFVVFLQMFRRY